MLCDNLMPKDSGKNIAKSKMNELTDLDTIVAIATPQGRGGIGVVRISGHLVKTIALKLLRICPKPRHASYLPFYDQSGMVLDEGIALFFPSPHSFTGEDVLELQGHGGPVVLDYLLKQVTAMGARLAKPGEFSQRAYLNGKCDLTQAEAIADLINSSSLQAARSALRSLTGVFSKKINMVKEDLIYLRTYIEAVLDFPDEEIELLKDKTILEKSSQIISAVNDIQQSAKQGVLLQEGVHCVIAGKPNAGKSSLLNALTEQQTAIVSDIAGTTRDLIRDSIQVKGISLRMIDTAGLRKSVDQIEQEGVKRALNELSKADVIVLVTEAKSFKEDIASHYYQKILNEADGIPVIIVKNKIDLTREEVCVIESKHTMVQLSVLNGEGIDTFKDVLAEKIGYDQTLENGFIARRRHLDALERTEQELGEALSNLNQGLVDVAAESLRQAQAALSEITGEFSSDDLLGEIFSSFCIGK